MSRIESDLMKISIDEGLPSRHVSICHYLYRNSNSMNRYFVDDLCRLIAFYASPPDEEFDLSIIDGAISIYVEKRILIYRGSDWHSVFGTIGIVIDPSSINGYPCIHTWIFGSIEITNAVIGIFLKDGRCKQRGDSFCKYGYSYEISNGTVMAPFSVYQGGSKSFQRQTTRPKRVAMKLDEKQSIMAISVDNGPFQVAHRRIKKGRYVLAISLAHGDDSAETLQLIDHHFSFKLRHRSPAFIRNRLNEG